MSQRIARRRSAARVQSWAYPLSASSRSGRLGGLPPAGPRTAMASRTVLSPPRDRPGPSPAVTATPAGAAFPDAGQAATPLLRAQRNADAPAPRRNPRLSPSRPAGCCSAPSGAHCHLITCLCRGRHRPAGAAPPRDYRLGRVTNPAVSMETRPCQAARSKCKGLGYGQEPNKRLLERNGSECPGKLSRCAHGFKEQTARQVPEK